MSQTLDQIFLNSAAKKPDATALSADPECHNQPLSPTNEITYQQAADYIVQTAADLRSRGLKDGDILLTQLPSLIETPLLLLAIMNAGLVPCLIPSQWRRKEIEAAISALTPSAALAHPTNKTDNPFEALFEIAAQELSFRYIFGLDPASPDGVTPLPVLNPRTGETTGSDSGQFIQNEAPLFRRSGEQVAMIAWTHDQEGQPKPVAHTHIQLMANAYMVTEGIMPEGRKSKESGKNAPHLMTHFNPASLPGFIAAFIPWVTEAASLHLTTNLKTDDVISIIKQRRIDYALIPHGISSALSSTMATQLPEEERPTLVSFASSPARAIAGTTGETPTTQLYNLNGLCLARAVNNPGEGLLRLGPQQDKNGNTPTPPFIETRLQGATQKAADGTDVMRGRLELSGTAVGFTEWHDTITTTPLSNFDQHWEATSLRGKLVNHEMTRLEIETLSDIIYHGNHPLNGQELDHLYQAYPGFIDAAAFSIEDPLMGERLFAAIIPKPGDALSYDDFKNHLLAQQISPAKIPEKLVTVTEIPRDDQGLIARSEILR